jgi:ribonucleotide monophosphatase NagD (HAD superfamily)
MLVAAARALYDLDPIVLGKPSQYYADAIREWLPVDASIVVFGDSQRADIGTSHYLGADGVLVTSGDPRPDLPRPHYVTTRVGDVVRELEPTEQS